MHGDLTTTGAVCIASSTTCFEEGRAFLSRGDKTTPCPKCGRVGVIVEGEPTVTWDDEIAAVNGSLVHCGCPLGTNRLIAPDEDYIPDPPAMRRATPALQPLNKAALEEEEEEEELQPAQDRESKQTQQPKPAQGITLHLGLFFDGTGNNQGNSAIGSGCWANNFGLSVDMAEAVHKHCLAYGYTADGVAPDNSYGNDTSNVARLYELYPDDAYKHLETGSDKAYLKVYLEGIGTRSGLSDSRFSQATGRGATGVLARVEQVPAQVMERLRTLRDNNPGLIIRKIEIDLFGFSRGAAAARHCANDLLVGPGSGLARTLAAGSPLLCKDFTWRHQTDFELNFIGLFDTVAGIVEPLRGDFSPHNAVNRGVNLYLRPGAAREVVQLVAAHEYRHNFSLTRTDNDVDVPGSHSDVGGGYLPLAIEKLLLSKPESSFSPRQQANERSEAYRRTQEAFERTQAHWHTFFSPEQLSIGTWDMPVPGQAREYQPQKRVFAALTGKRQVRGELSLVYLRIMRALAVRAGVAFDPIPATPAFALPAELRSIARGLQAYAMKQPFTPLSVADQTLLQRHYIHLSAHWNASVGNAQSALEVIFLNRPADGLRRKKYENE